MQTKLFLGILSSVIAVICFTPYLRDIFRRKTQPHAYSWLVWAVLQVVGVAAQLKDGAGFGAWSLAIGSLFCLSIFLLSFKYGTKNVTRFDALCLGAALVAFSLYFGLKNPLWAVIAVSTIDFVGFLPTFRKGYEEPWTETPSAFILSALANVVSFFALQHYSVTTVLYLVSLFITNSSFAIMILARRKVLSAGVVQ